MTIADEVGVIVGGVYVHYKGDLYTVLNVAEYHDTREKFVVYRSHKLNTINLRPMFGTPADPDGFLTPKEDGTIRFVFVGMEL